LTFVPLPQALRLSKLRSKRLYSRVAKTTGR
jgi:hypothetical protein